VPDPRYQVFGAEAEGATHTVIAAGPAGFGANWWTRIAPSLPGVRILAARLPGRETRLSEPPMTDLHALVDDIAGWAGDEMGAATALIGVCSGCALVSELAARLASASPAPALLLVNPPETPIPENPYARMSSADLAEELVADGTLPPKLAASQKVFALFEATIRADFTAVERYVPPVEDGRRRFAVLAADRDAADAAGWAVPGPATVRAAVSSQDITVQPAGVAPHLLDCLAALAPAR
jgi:medium-chain acyl-[acyl-carrier-protein] hydrolase